MALGLIDCTALPDHLPYHLPINHLFKVLARVGKQVVWDGMQGVQHSQAGNLAICRIADGPNPLECSTGQETLNWRFSLILYSPLCWNARVKCVLD